MSTFMPKADEIERNGMLLMQLEAARQSCGRSGISSQRQAQSILYTQR